METGESDCVAPSICLRLVLPGVLKGDEHCHGGTLNQLFSGHRIGFLWIFNGMHSMFTYKII